jgi:hypothetical protein
MITLEGRYVFAQQPVLWWIQNDIFTDPDPYPDPTFQLISDPT